MTDVEIRPLGPDDDLDAQIDLGERAFGVMSATEREYSKLAMAEKVRSGSVLGAFVGGCPAGSATYHDMRQWWYGCSMPMAGVASVKVAPEYRGRGIGMRMMTELLGQIAERGYPVSALYPATMPIYRSLGWELAGGRYQVTVPSRELRSLLDPDAALRDAARREAAQPGAAQPGARAGHGNSGPDFKAAVNAVDLRRASPDDAAAVIEVIGQAYEAGRYNGPLTRTAESVRHWLSRDGLYAYLAADGFLAYRWNGGDEMSVERLVAASPLTGRALWSVLAGHSSTAGTIRAVLPPEDPLWWLTRERDVAMRRSMWMLRVVDAPAAVAARGFPPAVSLSVPVIIADPARPSNAGRWQLEVADGKGMLTPAADGTRADDPLRLGARGLAALYAGTPVATLRHAGLVSGGSPETDGGLDAAFGGPAFMLEGF